MTKVRLLCDQTVHAFNTALISATSRPLYGWQSYKTPTKSHRSTQSCKPDRKSGRGALISAACLPAFSYHAGF